jgi:hypothetical protein
VREEICEGFSMHNATINMQFSEFESAEHQREQRVAALESVASSFNKCLSTWKPEVDASLTFVELELSKLNSFFDREAKSSAMPKCGVFPIGSTVAPQPATVNIDGPAGHHVEHFHRDCGSRQLHT